MRVERLRSNKIRTLVSFSTKSIPFVPEFILLINICGLALRTFQRYPFSRNFRFFREKVIRQTVSYFGMRDDLKTVFTCENPFSHWLGPLVTVPAQFCQGNTANDVSGLARCRIPFARCVWGVVTCRLYPRVGLLEFRKRLDRFLQT
jgi:hypothetical protein